MQHEEAEFYFHRRRRDIVDRHTRDMEVLRRGTQEIRLPRFFTPYLTEVKELR